MMPKIYSHRAGILVARDGKEVEEQLQGVLNDPALARKLVEHGLKTIRSRHTCAHRIDELLAIDSEVRHSRQPAGRSQFQISTTQLSEPAVGPARPAPAAVEG